jgi:hypothetical protein
MKRIDITISVVYDDAKFPEDDMTRACDKISECDAIWNIGYDSYSWNSTTTVSKPYVVDDSELNA